MDILTFPYAVLPIRSFRADIVGSVISGGITQAGQQQVVNATGGGLWALVLEFNRWSRPEQIRSWRSIQYGQQGGVVPVNIAICDLRQAPLPTGYRPGSGLVPHSDGSPFSDRTLYSTPSIAAWLVTPIVARGTKATVQMGPGSVIKGGEFFSLQNQDGTSELKVVTGVRDVIGGQEITFLPPCRRAHDAGEPVNFDHPTGTFRLAQQDAMSMATENGRFGDGRQASFIEYIPGAAVAPDPTCSTTPFDFAAYLDGLVT